MGRGDYAGSRHTDIATVTWYGLWAGLRYPGGPGRAGLGTAVPRPGRGRQPRRTGYGTRWPGVPE
jgi:hypothetical protein